jgi:phosphatidylserine/phosphatidylglycerophosphate/cardiolipin synthase-like enzyme
MLEVAAKRGVRVRMLMDAKFQKTYPAELARLDALPNVEVQLLDVGKLTGGVQHAKYFVVDGQIGWLGSQNFDWRSLDHIHEIGVAFTEPQAVSALQAVFDADWARTGADVVVPASAEPVKGQPVAVQYEGAEAQVLLVASPPRLNPPGVATELPALISAIDAAKTAVNVQVMSYALVGYDKVYWDELDRALRRAAARKVEVRLLVADWSTRKGKLAALQSLDVLDHLSVKVLQVPTHSSGPIEFARVIHAKYMTVDGGWSWVGTSNWSRDYFENSRDVGLTVGSAAFAQDLDRVFERLWASEYAKAAMDLGGGD